MLRLKEHRNSSPCVAVVTLVVGHIMEMRQDGGAVVVVVGVVGVCI